MKNILRVGIVSSVDERDATARVVFGDREDVVSYNMDILSRGSFLLKDYWLPDVNEQVWCLFCRQGMQMGLSSDQRTIKRTWCQSRTKINATSVLVMGHSSTMIEKRIP
ncbi:hypothetical protein ACFSND_03970 [Brevibacillus brevis]|uniref:hypothetical protein n=1 Tax=Brevibacillus brevis TaxID=1393 RepID=UPI0036395929